MPKRRPTTYVETLSHENVIRFISIEKGKDGSSRPSLSEIGIHLRAWQTLFVSPSIVLDSLTKCSYFSEALKSGLAYLLVKVRPTYIALHNIIPLKDECGQIVFKLDAFSLLRSHMETTKDKERISAQNMSLWQNIVKLIFHVCTGNDSETITHSDMKGISELPPTCPISLSLHASVLRLLNGLWNKSVIDSESIGSFCSLVEDTTERLGLNVYSSVTGQNLTAYVRKSVTYEQLKGHLFELTDVPPSNQLLLLKEKPLYEIYDVTKEIQYYSKNILESKLYLYDIKRTGQSHYIRKSLHIPHMPELPTVPEQPSSLEVMSAPATCRKLMSSTHYVCACLEKMIACHRTQENAEVNLRHYVVGVLQPLKTEMKIMQQVMTDTRLKLTSWYDTYKSIPPLIDFVLDRATSSGGCTYKAIHKELTTFSDCFHDETYLSFLGYIENALKGLTAELDDIESSISTQKKDMLTTFRVCKDGQILRSKKSRINQIYEKMSQIGEMCDGHSSSDDSSVWKFIILSYKNEMQNLNSHRESLEKICREDCIPTHKAAFSESATRMSSLVEILTELEEKKIMVEKLQAVFEGSVKSHLPDVEDHVKTITLMTQQMVESQFRGIKDVHDVKMMR